MESLFLSSFALFHSAARTLALSLSLSSATVSVLSNAHCSDAWPLGYSVAFLPLCHDQRTASFETSCMFWICSTSAANVNRFLFSSDHPGFAEWYRISLCECLYWDFVARWLPASSHLHPLQLRHPLHPIHLWIPSQLEPPLVVIQEDSSSAVRENVDDALTAAVLALTDTITSSSSISSRDPSCDRELTPCSKPYVNSYHFYVKWHVPHKLRK